VQVRALTVQVRALMVQVRALTVQVRALTVGPMGGLVTAAVTAMVAAEVVAMVAAATVWAMPQMTRGGQRLIGCFLMTVATWGLVVVPSRSSWISMGLSLQRRCGMCFERLTGRYRAWWMMWP
jgi:hypothetical protein